MFLMMMQTFILGALLALAVAPDATAAARLLPGSKTTATTTAAQPRQQQQQQPAEQLQQPSMESILINAALSQSHRERDLQQRAEQQFKPPQPSPRTVFLAEAGGRRASPAAAPDDSAAALSTDGPAPTETTSQHATFRPIGRVPSCCDPVKVVTAFTPLLNATTGRRSLNGTVTVTNTGPNLLALQRVGVRMCSRLAQGHARVEAACDSYDVAAGATLVCTWRLVLPPGPLPGSELVDWTGVFSSAQESLTGERCASPVVNPATGLVGGTCTAV